jgi:L-iditol 2-dehydrogenase
MRALMWRGGRDLRVEEVPTPEPGPGEVLVRIVACGVCGTDLHAVDGSVPWYQPPRILGHEASGVVAAVGAGVQGVRVGQAVAVEPSSPCGACAECHDGLEQHCRRRRSALGGFAQYACVPERSAVPLPEGVPVEVGSLAEPTGCCLHAVDVAGLRSGATAVVVGAGPIGLTLVQLARRSGAAQVVVSEPDGTRRRLARELGADVAVDPTAEALPAVVHEVTGGLGADVVFEAVGRPDLVGVALDALRRGGAVVVVGLAPRGATLAVDLYELHVRELAIKTAWTRSYSFRRAVAWLRHLDLAPLITHRYSLDRALEALMPQPGRVKAIIEPWS